MQRFVVTQRGIRSPEVERPSFRNHDANTKQAAPHGCHPNIGDLIHTPLQQHRRGADCLGREAVGDLKRLAH